MRAMPPILFDFDRRRDERRHSAPRATRRNMCALAQNISGDIGAMQRRRTITDIHASVRR